VRLAVELWMLMGAAVIQASDTFCIMTGMVNELSESCLNVHDKPRVMLIGCLAVVRDGERAIGAIVTAEFAAEYNDNVPPLYGTLLPSATVVASSAHTTSDGDTPVILPRAKLRDTVELTGRTTNKLNVMLGVNVLNKAHEGKTLLMDRTGATRETLRIGVTRVVSP
jgi:hypothetical protein